MIFLKSSQLRNQMANTTANRGHRPKKKGGVRITANLANLDLVEYGEMNRTDAIDLALKALSILQHMKKEGSTMALRVLAKAEGEL
jgi:hypothetical protein